MPHVVLIHATFANKSDADHVYNQALSVATNASVARIGEPGERTSWGAQYEESAAGEMTAERQWHVDRFGIVRGGSLLPDDQIPDWIQPAGAQDAYPAQDVFGNPTRVRHSGQVWENIHGAGNVWVPGVFGWVQV